MYKNLSTDELNKRIDQVDTDIVICFCLVFPFWCVIGWLIFFNVLGTLTYPYDVLPLYVLSCPIVALFVYGGLLFHKYDRLSCELLMRDEPRCESIPRE